jgi:alpha-N-arabinofuranosidase
MTPTTFHNPILPGFYPDPSVCRVAEDYYLVTSSFEYFPGVPLFHSRDLVHWRQIGHCLTRPSQLPLERARSSGGVFAPTIRHHAGRFYMVTTNVSHGGHFYVTTDDIHGEWSEPIRVEQGGIDPSLLFDADGRVYFTSTGDGNVVQCEIDIATGKRLTETRFVWGGTGGQYPEAPHLYRIGDRYYLTIAEGGTEYGHMETIARSDSPWGPFEPCPRNPILTHRSLSHPIQALGHADLVQTQAGEWWMVCLGIRPNGYPPCHHLGRETFLAPVRWDADVWPVVGENGRIALEMPTPDLPPHPWPQEPERDEFDSPTLLPCWNFLRNPSAEDWSLTERSGWLTLHGSAITLDEADSLAFVGRRQQHFDCEATTLLEFAPQRDGEEAGLTALMNERHHYEIALTRREGVRQVIVRRRIGSLQAIVAQAPFVGDRCRLSILADRNRYRFRFGPPDGDLHDLAEGETCYLSKEVAGGFTGVYFGLYATGNAARNTTPAHFAWFEYKAF